MLEQRVCKQEEGEVLLEVQMGEGLWHFEPFVGHNEKGWHVQGRLLCWTGLRF